MVSGVLKISEARGLDTGVVRDPDKDWKAASVEEWRAKMCAIGVVDAS